MKEKNDLLVPKKLTQEEASAPQPGTPYWFANLGIKTFFTSLAVSTVTLPFNALLTHIQMPTSSPLRNGFRGLYSGFLPHAIAGQQRGAVAVTSKHANKEHFEEEVEANLAFRSKWVGTVAFAQVDHLLSNALYGKSKLTSVGIINSQNFNWTPYNAYKLTIVNWGSRSIAGFVNFAAIGFVGDKCSSLYHFDNELYNKVLGGATAGIIATFFTTIPNAYADRKLLATKVENKCLISTSPFTLFNQMKAHVTEKGFKAAAADFAVNKFLREFIVRSPQTALTFATILAMDHLMGPDPLKAVWPKSRKDFDVKETATPYEASTQSNETSTTLSRRI